MESDAYNAPFRAQAFAVSVVCKHLAQSVAMTHKNMRNGSRTANSTAATPSRSDFLFDIRHLGMGSAQHERASLCLVNTDSERTSQNLKQVLRKCSLLT